MSILHKIFAPLLAVATTVTAAPLLEGCAARGQAVLVEASPPPVREETVVYRPGYVWVHGRWARNGDRWAWSDGYYQRERPGYVYVEGRWAPNGDRHVWIEGGWRRRTAVGSRERR